MRRKLFSSTQRDVSLSAIIEVKVCPTMKVLKIVDGREGFILCVGLDSFFLKEIEMRITDEMCSVVTCSTLR